MGFEKRGCGNCLGRGKITVKTKEGYGRLITCTVCRGTGELWGYTAQPKEPTND